MPLPPIAFAIYERFVPIGFRRTRASVLQWTFDLHLAESNIPDTGSSVDGAMASRFPPKSTSTKRRCLGRPWRPAVAL